MTIKILAFDGSGRTGSINRNVLTHVVAEAKAQGAEVTQINLRELDLPLYNGDLEAQGLPEAVIKLKDLFKSHDALLIASPEHNGTFSSLLKNTIDWVSRRGDDATPLAAFQDKIAGMVVVSPGKLSGMRGVAPLNSLLFGLGVTVLPTIVSIGFYNDAVDENGALKNDNEKKAVANLAKRLVTVTKALKQ